jgi:hypothetical protein
MAVIMDAVGNFYDKPAADEDELGGSFDVEAYAYSVREDFANDND